MQFAIINRKLLASEKAMVPISDRGLRFGDGVFETIAVHAGAPYQWALHEDRLKNGLKTLGIAADISRLKEDCLLLLKKNKLEEGFLRVMVTRGSGSEGYLPAPTDVPTIIIESTPRRNMPKYADLFVSNFTKAPNSAYPAIHKTMQGLNSTLARMEANNSGCLDALMLSDRKFLCETSSANLFWVKGGKLFTPSLSAGCLAGTTRAAILRLSPLPVKEGRFREQALKEAEAAFITNVNWQVLPVHSIVPWNVRYKQDNPLIRQLQALYVKDIADHVAQQ